MEQVENFSQVFPEQEILADQVTDKKVQMAWQLFVSLEYQVQVADRKVQAVFGLNAFLVAALSLQSQQSLHQILASSMNFSLALDLFFKACFLGCVCVATWSAIRALSPRVKAVQGNSSVKRTSLFFFGDIQSKSHNDFTSAFFGMSNFDAATQILFQSQAISKILSTKYKYLKRSTIFLSVALMIWILLQINKFLS